MDVHHGGIDAAAVPAAICRYWFADAASEIVPLAASGFSGSQVLQVRCTAAADAFVLKNFHAGTSRERAAWVHRLAGHLRSQGIVHVPELIPTRDGDTVVADASGALWELCRFMPGVAVRSPDPRQAAAAAAALARLHLAAEKLPGACPSRGPSPGIQRRIEQARRLKAAPWHGVWPAGQRIHDRHGPTPDELVAAVASRLDAAIEAFVAVDGQRAICRVAELQAVPLTVQPVLRDIWCDHVLYSSPVAADVTGIVDLHAAGIDTPATDIARLLGSWAVSEGFSRLSPVDRHPAAIEAYERIRPLRARERGLIGFLHATAVIFGLDNWFRWVLEERRQFSSTPRVLERIDSLMQELRPAIAQVADAAVDREGIVD